MVKKKFHVGDVVRCCFNKAYHGDENYAITLGNYYTVTKVKIETYRDLSTTEVWVINDKGQEACYRPYHFEDVKSLRKDKLRKIEGSL